MRMLHPESWIVEDEVNPDEIVIAASRAELTLIANSLNEVLEAVEEWEFDTRIGGSQETARTLRSRIGALLKETRRPE